MAAANPLEIALGAMSKGTDWVSAVRNSADASNGASVKWASSFIDAAKVVLFWVQTVKEVNPYLGASLNTVALGLALHEIDEKRSLGQPITLSPVIGAINGIGDLLADFALYQGARTLQPQVVAAGLAVKAVTTALGYVSLVYGDTVLGLEPPPPAGIPGDVVILPPVLVSTETMVLHDSAGAQLIEFKRAGDRLVGISIRIDGAIDSEPLLVKAEFWPDEFGKPKLSTEFSSVNGERLGSFVQEVGQNGGYVNTIKDSQAALISTETSSVVNGNPIAIRDFSNGSQQTVVRNASGEIVTVEDMRPSGAGTTISELRNGLGVLLQATITTKTSDGGFSVVTSRPDGSEVHIKRDANGNQIGLPVYVASYAETLGTAISDTASLINAIKNGQPLPVLVSGLRLANTLDRNHVVPGLGTATSLGSAALSLYSLSQALKNGDGLDVISSAANAVNAVGQAVQQVTGNANAVTQFFGSSGPGANILPGLGLIIAIKNGDALGVATAVAQMMTNGPLLATPVGWVLAVAQLARAMQDTPEAWGMGNFKFGSGTDLVLQVSGEGVGKGKVDWVMHGNGKPRNDPAYFGGVQGYLEGLVSQANTANPQEPLGIIPQRMASVVWREARQSDPGFAVTDIDPLTGQAKRPELRYDDDLKPFNTTGTAPEDRYNLLERLITSAIARGAVAPMWEVNTAKLQEAAGDPLAGLTEVERASRGGYLAQLDAAGKPVAGKFRPVALDLNGDGQITITPKAGSTRAFNWDDSGFDKAVGWVGASEGLLYLDRNPNGAVDSGAELFSNSRISDVAKGLRSLSAVDANGDGLINAADPVFNELRIWQDTNADGRSTPNELKKLAEWGITELDYKNSRFTRNGQLKSMESPDLEASSEGTRVSVTAEGIKVELSDGTVKIYASRVNEKSLYPGVSTIGTAAAVEGNAVDFLVSLSAPGAGVTDVNIALYDGTAQRATDLQLPMQVSFDGGRTFADNPDGLVHVPAGLTQFTLRVRTIDDILVEGRETFEVRATSPSNLVPAIASGEIIDNDVDLPLVSVTGPVTANEESDVELSYTVSLSKASSTAVTLNWSTLSGSAAGGYDYLSVSPTALSFQPGEREKTVKVRLINDTLVESAETFQVVLSSVVGANVGVGSITTSIQSGDESPAALLVKNVYASGLEVFEGSPAVFVVQLNQAVGADGGAPVGLSLVSDGSAQLGSDFSSDMQVSFNGGATYSAAGSSVLVPKGKVDFLVKVPTIRDAVSPEANESFLLEARTAANTSGVRGAVTIKNLAPITVGFTAGPNEAVKEGVVSKISYTVALSEASASSVTVAVGVAAGGTATKDTDFKLTKPATGNLVFAPGELEKTVEVELVDDTTFESALESFTLSLSGAVGAALGSTTTWATTILDNDPDPTPPPVALAVSSVSSGDAFEGGSIAFTVNLNRSVNKPGGEAVEVALSGGVNAVAGVDFRAQMEVSTNGVDFAALAGGSVVVPNGKSSFTLRVATIQDAVADPNETFYVKARVGADAWKQGTGTINDKPPVSLNLTAGSASLDEGASNLVTYTATLTEASTETVTVDYEAVSGTATLGTDFVLKSQPGGLNRLVFLPGQTSKTFQVESRDDSVYEGDETFTVKLKDVSGPAVLGTGSLTTKLIDNDAKPPPAFSVSDETLAAAMLEDQPTTLYSVAELLKNDYFGGVSGDKAESGLKISDLVAGVGVKTITLQEGNVAVTLLPNFNGQAAFTYTVTATKDGDGRTATATAQINVTSVDDAPTITFNAIRRPIYGWGPRVQWVTEGSGEDRIQVAQVFPDEGLAQYSPYQTVQGQRMEWTQIGWGESEDFAWRPVGGLIDTPIPKEYFDKNWKAEGQTINWGGARYWLQPYPGTVLHSSAIDQEVSNDGEIVVTDIDSDVSQYTLADIRPVDSNVGVTTIVSARSFTFTGIRYVDVKPDGTPIGNNVKTDDYGRFEERYPVPLDVVLKDAAGKTYLISDKVQVTHFGPKYNPNVHNGSKKPIAIDLNGDGFHFTDIDDANVFFDVNGDGWRRKMAWNNPQDGFIAYDKNGDGKITSFDELSFVAYKPDGQSDIEGLKAFDTNKDGVFSAADAQWAKFGVWRDANSNGVTDAGELLTLSSLGINRIELTTDGKLEVINGQSVTGKGRAVKGDGSAYAIADVTLKYRDVTLVTPTDGSAPMVVPIPKYQPGQTFEGTAGKDLILGAAGSDVFHAGDGDDVIHDDGGNDHVQAGAGNDLVFTGMDNDVIEAGSGNDQVFAGVGDDLVFGEEGDDVLMLEAGNDVAFGGAGNDMISGGNGNDALSGDLGDDKIFGEDGWDALFGKEGDDELRGMVGNDLLYGDAGNDLLSGGEGEDQMEGGTGDDTYEVDSLADKVVELVNEGRDTVMASISYSLAALPEIENLSLTGTGDLIARGNDAANRLIGNAGNNELVGAGGDDALDGGAGADKMEGGIGNDAYFIDNAGDTVVEVANGGVDTVNSRIGYILGAELENLNLIGIGAIDGKGNALNNILIGNAAANVLDGAAGADDMRGGEGNDRYLVDNANDTVTELGSGGYDTVVVSNLTTYTMLDNVEALEIGAGVSARSTGIGNALDNFITGSASANTLIGLGGNDLLMGEGGIDILEGGDGNDVLDGGAGGDAMKGGAGDDRYIVDNATDVTLELAGSGRDTVFVSGLSSRVLAANIEDLELGAGVLSGTGNTLNNLITGSADANTLLGLAGDDVLKGGAGDDGLGGGDGADTLYGDAGNDTLTGGTGDDTLNGGDGDDTFLLTTDDDGFDAYDGGTGFNRILGGAAVDVLRVSNSLANLKNIQELDGGDTTSENKILGTAGADNLDFSAMTVKNFVIDGQDGDDSITGTAGADRLCGGNGIDSLRGGAGADYLEGGAGIDRYLWNLGDGFDTISDNALGAENELFFGAGVGINDVSLQMKTQAYTLDVAINGQFAGAVKLVRDQSGFEGGFQIYIGAEIFKINSQLGTLELVSGSGGPASGGESVNIGDVKERAKATSAHVDNADGSTVPAFVTPWQVLHSAMDIQGNVPESLSVQTLDQDATPSLIGAALMGHYRWRVDTHATGTSL